MINKRTSYKIINFMTNTWSCFVYCEYKRSWLLRRRSRLSKRPEWSNNVFRTEM